MSTEKEQQAKIRPRKNSQAIKVAHLEKENQLLREQLVELKSKFKETLENIAALSLGAQQIKILVNQANDIFASLTESTPKDFTQLLMRKIIVDELKSRFNLDGR